MTGPYFGPEPAAYWAGREFDPDVDPVERDDYEDDRRGYEDDESMTSFYGYE